VFSRLFNNPFLHTTTFGGNPLACAAALATISVLIDEKLPERAGRMGQRMLGGMMRGAQRHRDIVLDIRGRGLLMALEFASNELGFAFGKEMLARGVLVAGTLVNALVVRVEPPLTITEEQADYVCKALEESLDAVSRAAVPV
jgi:putrescine aminotransferase